MPESLRLQDRPEFISRAAIRENPTLLFSGSHAEATIRAIVERMHKEYAQPGEERERKNRPIPADVTFSA